MPNGKRGAPSKPKVIRHGFLLPQQLLLVGFAGWNVWPEPVRLVSTILDLIQVPTSRVAASVMAAYTVFIRIGKLHVLLQQLENLKNSVSEKKLNGYTVPLSGISLSTVHS